MAYIFKDSLLGLEDSDLSNVCISAILVVSQYHHLKEKCLHRSEGQDIKNVVKKKQKQLKIMANK